ncbi:MAG: efflux RND transporter periplasmic adaptor subunit [Gammaproteobacteria bacterium]
MNKTPKKYFIFLLVGIGLVVTLLVWTKPVQRADLKETPPTHVAVADVSVRDLAAIDTVTGRLQAARKAVLQFELAGQLAERKVEPGQRVEAGQVLLTLPDGDYQDALADVQAQLEQARASSARDRELLALAGREKDLQAQAVERFERLGRDALASKAQADEARARLLQLQSELARLRYSTDTAQATLRQREAAVSRAARNLERTSLKAPFSGIVNAVHVQPGDAVAPNVPAVELLDIEQLDLYVEVAGASAAALKLGQQVKVRAGDPATPVQTMAEVVALQSDPNLATHTYAVRLRLPGRGLLPGTLAAAELPLTPLRNVLVVPVAAVEQDEGSAYVFTVRNGIAQRTQVKLGARVQDVQVITAGVQVGEKIVARDVAALADGERVVAQL